MASFKSHPVFFTSLLLAGALTAGQAWLLFSQRSAAKKVAVEIKQKQERLDAFGRANPFPSRENEKAIEEDRAGIEKIRDEIRGRLRATGPVAEKIASATTPASATDAYFDIASFVENMREVAQKAGVSVAPTNRFGFAVYASTGPTRELIPQVFQQRLYSEYLLEALLRSGPTSFVSLQREQPLTAAQRREAEEAELAGQPIARSSDASATGDYFVIDPRTSARVKDFVETIPFRLTFTGSTDSLRFLLNELVTFKIPVVVRSVEVEPVKSTADSAARRPAAPRPPTGRPGVEGVGGRGSPGVLSEAEAMKALVEPGESRFIVTVEVISLVDKNSEDSASSDSTL